MRNLTSFWTQRKWTERQNLLSSTVAPGMDSVLAVRARCTWKLQVAKQILLLVGYICVQETVSGSSSGKYYLLDYRQEVARWLPENSFCLTIENNEH
jgi:hypothetical protein